MDTPDVGRRNYVRHGDIHQHISPTTIIKAFTPRDMIAAVRSQARETERVVAASAARGTDVSRAVRRRRSV
jgi:hypothetical protein